MGYEFKNGVGVLKTFTFIFYIKILEEKVWTYNMYISSKDWYYKERNGKVFIIKVPIK